MDERRELPRWQIRKEAKMWIQQAQSFTHCVIEDLHLKGMRVSFNKQLSHNHMASMSFALGESFDLMKIEVAIPWSRQQEGRYVYGFSFKSIADQDKDRIYKYITGNCLDQFKIKWWSMTL